MATQVVFKKAVKYEAKGRVALIGPSGSGKSMTMLEMATLLANGGLITAVDTEHGSLSKYADLYDFSVIEPDNYSPDVFFATLKAAEDAGAVVHCVDSLSHFWMGQGGALEWVDMAKKRSTSRDDMSGWKDFSPVERRMIDAIISSPCHVIVTMRTKTEYQEEEFTNSRGEKKKKRVKVGLAPVQRQGLEYEFDLIGYMNEENEFLTDKTRCSYYKKEGAVIVRPGGKNFQPFADWLKGAPADRRESKPEVTRGPELVQDGSAEAAQAVAQRKIAEFKARGTAETTPPPPPVGDDPVEAYASAIDRAKSLLKEYVGDSKNARFLESAYPLFWEVDKWARVAKLYPEKIQTGNNRLKAFLDERRALLAIWTNQFDMLKDFAEQKERVGEETYYTVLKLHGVEKSNEFKTPVEGIKAFMELRKIEVKA